VPFSKYLEKREKETEETGSRKILFKTDCFSISFSSIQNFYYHTTPDILFARRKNDPNRPTAFFYGLHNLGKSLEVFLRGKGGKKIPAP